MLKTIEKLVDRHIRGETLGLCPQHPYQFQYQPAKPNKIALHDMITHIQQAVENRKVKLGVFLDINEVLKEPI